MNKILFYKTFYQNFQTFNNYNFSYKENKIVDNQLLDISTKEFEAETTAYLVCCSLGMFDNLEYSRGYISQWIKRSDIEEINFKRAFDCANKILQAGLIKNDIIPN